MRKKTLMILALAVAGCFSAGAQTARKVVDKVIAAYETSGGIEATYVVKSIEGTTSGTIAMSGEKFRILSDALKSWYDGTTQWSYSKMTGEVNITTPTSDELLTTSPYLAITTLKSTSKLTLNKVDDTYVVAFKPRTSESVSSVSITVDASTYQIQKAVFTLSDKTTCTTTIKNYVTGMNYEDETFVFDKSLVPDDAQVVDLR